MKHSATIQNIKDRLSYTLLYAPDYPEEDQTSLDKEEQQIQKTLSDVIRSVQRVDFEDWLLLSSTTVKTAFAKFRVKQNREARKDVEIAIEHLKCALAQKPRGARFISAPDGTIARPQSE